VVRRQRLWSITSAKNFQCSSWIHGLGPEMIGSMMLRSEPAERVRSQRRDQGPPPTPAGRLLRLPQRRDRRLRDDRPRGQYAGNADQQRSAESPDDPDHRVWRVLQVEYFVREEVPATVAPAAASRPDSSQATRTRPPRP